MDTSKFIVFDTETTGLDVVNDRAFMLCFTTDGKKYTTIRPDAKTGIFDIRFWAALKDANVVVGHNIKYDLHMVYNNLPESKRDAFIKLLESKLIVDTAVLTRLVESVDFGSVSLLNITKKYDWEYGYEIKDSLGSWLYANKIKRKDHAAYEKVPDEILVPYCENDVVLTYNILERHKDYILTDVAMIEWKAMLPCFLMERCGWKIDVPYLEKCKLLLEQEYDSLLMKWRVSMGDSEISPSQHARIKKILKEKGLNVTSVDAKSLKALAKQGLSDMTTMLQKLRTIEKWLNTYVIGILNKQKNGYITTQYNAAGTITGRYSSDFQQFPKYPLFSLDGTELFSPRKMHICDDTDTMVYIDISQQELRVQAEYTRLISNGKGDFNLCNAYENVAGVDDWTPTDLHELTAKGAYETINKGETFPTKEQDADTYKKWRNLAKGFNFAKIYGQSVAGASESLGVDIQTAQALSDGFSKYFPLVNKYQKMVMDKVKTFKIITNLYGRQYRFTDMADAYKGCNYLIQGSCGYMLKAWLPLLYARIKELNAKHNLNIRLKGTVHDEVMFLVNSRNRELVEQVSVELQKVMQTLTINFSIPIVAEISYSTTTWADKGD